MLPIVFLPPAERYFKKLKDKKLKLKFLEAINILRNDPKQGKPKRGDLAGVWGYDLYHDKTNFEIAYYLTTNTQGEIIVVIMAGTRENFWEAVKSYIK